MVEQGDRQGADWTSGAEEPAASIEQKVDPARSPEIKVALADQINFACHQNAVPLVRDLVVAKRDRPRPLRSDAGADGLTGLRVRQNLVDRQALGRHRD